MTASTSLSPVRSPYGSRSPRPTVCSRRIFDAAGIASPAPAGCAVYADSRLCGIFPKDAVKFKLPLKGEFRDAITQKTLAGGVEISIPAKGALVLVPKE